MPPRRTPRQGTPPAWTAELRRAIRTTVGVLAALVAAPASGGGPGPAFHSSDFRSARSCKRCHPRQYLEWRGSAHAYAFVDPVFRACHRKAVEDTGGAIGTHCLDCHSPIGVRSGELSARFEEETEDGALAATAREGVTCVVCHRMEPLEGDAPTGGGSYRLEPGEVVYGGLHEPRETAAHGSAESAFLASSASCGSCHDVLFEGRRIERTFAEWRDSAFAARGVRCHECHMLPYSGRAAEGGPFRDRLHRHGFPGITLPFGSLSRANEGYQREHIREFLRASVRLSVRAPGAVEGGATWRLPVTVKNSGTGHSLPVGSLRQMWIEVTVTGEEGDVLFRSGHLDLNGDLRDRHSELDPRGDPQLVLFSDSHQDEEGHETAYWKATRLVETALESLETRRVAYRIDVPEEATGSSIRLHVRVLIRAVAPYFLRAAGAAGLAGRVPVWEMQRFESGPIPVRDSTPRRIEYRVPGDFDGLQAAVDALEDGDRLLVAPGEYVLERPLDFRGKAVEVRGVYGAERTTLRRALEEPPPERASVAVFTSGEGAGSILAGFTLTGGRGTLVEGRRRGGGVFIRGASPALRDLRVLDCRAGGGDGGGIYCEGGTPAIRECAVWGCRAERGGGLWFRGVQGVRLVLRGTGFQGNVAREGGGLFVATGSHVRLERAIVAGNVGRRAGGGVFAGDGARLEIEHATFVRNRSRWAGGAVRAEAGAVPPIEGSIFWDNRPFRLRAGFAHSVVDRKLPPGSTNRSADPLFIDTGESLPASREAPTATGWVPGDYRLLPASPAIDLGDPLAPADPDDTPPDAGASFFEQRLHGFVRGDVDGDGDAGFADLLRLAAWRAGREDAIPACLDAADLDDDGRPGAKDIVLLAAHLFGAAVPAPPFPDCGLDPTPGEGLSCAAEPAGCAR